MEMVDRLTEKASDVKSLAKSMPRDISQAASCVTSYIRERGLSRDGLARMGRDLTGCVSKNPVQSAVALMALGFVTGMLVRKR